MAAAEPASPRPQLELPRLYGIADAEALGARPLAQAVLEMADAGLRLIQVRAKRASGAELCAMLDQLFALPLPSEVHLWIDDRVDLAVLYPVAGVHLGQTDLPPAAARSVLERRCFIGWSTHDDDQVRQAEADRAVDLVAIGPVFTTGSKRQPTGPDPTVGLVGVRRARALTTKPLVAIGGIEAGSAAAVIEAGADAVAVIGALCRGPSLRANARRLLAAVRGEVH